MSILKPPFESKKNFKISVSEDFNKSSLICHSRLKIEKSTIDTENGMTNMARKELLETRDVPYDLRPDYTLGEGK